MSPFSLRALVLLSLLSLVGCWELGTSSPGSVRVNAISRDGSGSTTVRMQVELGRALYVAMQSGVTIQLQWELQKLERGVFGSRVAWHQTGRRVLGYLSLRENFTLNDGHGIERHPNRRTLENALGSLRVDNVPPVAGDESYRFRIRLATSALPPPMRLPARMNPIWWFDSDWQAVSPAETTGV